MARMIRLTENRPLISAVDVAMYLFCLVFDLRRVGSTDFDFDEAFERMRSHNLTDEQLRRLDGVKEAHHDFHEDLSSPATRVPRSWRELFAALNSGDVLVDLTQRSQDALNTRPPAGRPNLSDVIKQTQDLIFWKIVRFSKTLVVQIDQKESFAPWYEKEVSSAVRRFANPSWIFRDWDGLKLVGATWEAYRKDNKLPSARGCKREHIEEKRKQVEVPQEIRDFIKELSDPEKAQELHAPVEAAVKSALRSWAARVPTPAIPDFDTVKDNMLDRLIWQAIKNGDAYVRERRVGAISWLPRLLPARHGRVRALAFQAIDESIGRPVNLPKNTTEPSTEIPVDVHPLKQSLTQQQELLHSAVAAMPDGDEKRALMLSLGYSRGQGTLDVEGEGLPIEDIAARLNITEQKVQQHLRAARKWLQQHLLPSNED